MSYLDKLREDGRKQRQEVDAIVRERARKAHKMHGLMCEENRHAMWLEFAERERNRHA